MTRQFNKGLVSAIILIFTISVAFFGCKKEEEYDLDVAKLTRQISSSNEFKEIFINLTEIKSIIKASSNYLQEKLVQEDFFQEATTLKSEDQLHAFLVKLEYSNAEEIVRRTSISNSLVAKTYQKFPTLYKLEKEQVISIFKEAYLLSLKENTNNIKLLVELDECASNYATGMSGCSDALAWDLVAAGVGGILALGGTPIASAGTVLAMAGVAYAKEQHCRSGVVSQWRACRSAHPIHG